MGNETVIDIMVFPRRAFHLQLVDRRGESLLLCNPERDGLVPTGLGRLIPMLISRGAWSELALLADASLA